MEVVGVTRLFVVVVNAARCPPRPSRARSVCGSTASSRAGQVAIQAWTGSGLVMSWARRNPRGEGKAGLGWAGWDAPCLGVLVGLRLRRVLDTVSDMWVACVVGQGSRTAVLGLGLGGLGLTILSQKRAHEEPRRTLQISRPPDKILGPADMGRWRAAEILTRSVRPWPP